MSSYLHWLLFLKKITVGLRALTVQSYTEANVKNGLQYETSSDAVALTASTGRVDIIMITGAKPVIIKSRIIDFVGKKIRASIFRAPNYSGGTAAAVYNLNDINPITSTVSVLSGATVTNTGVQFSSPNTIYGADLQGHSVQGTFAVSGHERVLRANTTYLFRLENLGDTAANVASYLTWYEGEPDLPAAEGAL